MRPRAVIVKEVRDLANAAPIEAQRFVNRAILEVLLDIRDLIQESGDDL